MKKNNRNQLNIERFNPSVQDGLSCAQVDLRLKQNLTNTVKNTYSKSYINIIVGNTFTFFNLLGVIVAIALVYIGAPPSRFFFVLIYLANILIGILQETRAKICIDKLSIVSAKFTKVIRNGKTTEIKSSEIVLDDVYILQLGNQIPTDSEILEGTVEVNESLLTGESVPIKKTVGDTLLAGSFITSGNCKCKAIKVGKDNYVEQLSKKAKKYKKPKSELMNSLKLIIKAIGVIIIPITVIHLIRSELLLKASLIDSISGVCTLIIGMIPSGMFLLTSVALAVGIIKLASHKTLVQDLYSLEMLARVDTVCFDKTGTITDGKMTVHQVLELKSHNLLPVKDVMRSMLFHLKDSNQTALALEDYFGKENKIGAVKILNFNSKRKLSAVTFDNGLTYAFGAPEFVLNEKDYKIISSTVEKYAKNGYRVLLLGESTSKIEGENAPKDFLPVAMITILDHVREDAIDTIKWFKNNNVAIKVISGDNPITVSEVSRRVGIENADRFISLEGLTDEQVYAVANDYTVFGRVSPEQKAILVKAMKDAGHTTAMTGDGVNDILALKEADCAITVACGSDAAKNVSHLVLLDNNFNSLPKVVYEGRRVINNVQGSASLYLMKTLFTIFFSLIIIFLPNVNAYPFQLSQMILLEVLIIGMPSFFLSLQPNDSKVEGRFIEQVLQRTLPSAILMILSVIAVYVYKTIDNSFPQYVYSTISVYALNFAGIISLYHISKPLNKYRSVLFFTVLIVIVAITLYSLFNGLLAFELVSLNPLSLFWKPLVLLIAVILLDIPLSFGLRYLFKKTVIKLKKQ